MRKAFVLLADCAICMAIYRCTEGYDFVDNLLAAQLVQAELLLDNQQLSPLPLLGVPGWYKEQEAAFYADTSYFRPKRHKPDSSEATEASAGNKA